MGCGVSNGIAINLDRTNSFYFSGEWVSGNVRLNIIKGKLEADEIYITLTGEIGYTTKRKASKDRGRTLGRNKYHHVPFYSAKFVFAQPQSGQNELVYDQGQYSWPFRILLPDHLPPTINPPQTYPHVRYYLQFVIDKPWYKPNSRETRYLTIFPRVNLLQNPQCLVSTIFGNQNRKDITLRGTLNKFGYVPGELIVVKLEIENPRRVLILRIDLSMLQSFQIGRNSRRFGLFETTLPRIIDLKDEQIIDTFSIIVPSIPLPPTYQFQGGLKAIANVRLHYFLKFTVRVEGMFTNFHIDVPIILGTEPNPDLNQQHTFNPLIVTYSSNPDQSMLIDDDDPPPPYESVVQNMK
jgi:hypothetical protein